MLLWLVSVKDKAMMCSGPGEQWKAKRARWRQLRQATERQRIRRVKFVLPKAASHDLIYETGVTLIIEVGTMSSVAFLRAGVKAW